MGSISLDNVPTHVAHDAYHLAAEVAFDGDFGKCQLHLHDLSPSERNQVATVWVNLFGHTLDPRAHVSDVVIGRGRSSQEALMDGQAVDLVNGKSDLVGARETWGIRAGVAAVNSDERVWQELLEELDRQGHATACEWTSFLLSLIFQRMLPLGKLGLNDDPEPMEAVEEKVGITVTPEDLSRLGLAGMKILFGFLLADPDVFALGVAMATARAQEHAPVVGMLHQEMVTGIGAYGMQECPGDMLFPFLMAAHNVTNGPASVLGIYQALLHRLPMATRPNWWWGDSQLTDCGDPTCRGHNRPGND